MARATCEYCARPASHCLCASVTLQPTNLPVLILQHIDESTHPFTTARIAELGATSVHRCDGLDFCQQALQARLSALGARSPVLLYKVHHYDEHRTFNLDLASSVPSKAGHEFDALLVLDGTWRNTRELILRNEWLSRLPVLTLQNTPETEYTIRSNSEGGTLSTIEAISAVLSVFEENFCSDSYLKPLRTMLSIQKRYGQRMPD